MIVTIHQPNFIPWVPFFDKMHAADIFVHLTCCQYEKGGYQNRFRLDGEWYTMGVKHGMDMIGFKEYADPDKDWQRIVDQLPQHARLLEDLGTEVGESLADTNMRIINRLAKILGIATENRIDFDMPTHITGTDRLVKLCQHHGATTYLSGPSGRKYLEMDKFKAAGIAVEFFEATDKRHVLEVFHATV